ncbi:NAD(P)-binding protein [Desulfosarcina alkanivorans]|nr:NAD(P)-binding protein [Desulfosarcina alkanivorans]
MQPKKTIGCMAELPAMPATIGSMAWNQTGTWRYFTAVPMDKTPPCRAQCPAGMPIPNMINALKARGADGALAEILAQNPLPGLTGRLCYHPCQSRCVRRELDQPVAIQQIERYLADRNATGPQPIEPTDVGRVAVLGAGPFGLACAYFLRLKGVDVAVMDDDARAGGYLLETPPGKLDPGVLDREIDRLVRRVHLDLQLGQAVSGDDIPRLADQFDAVILDPTSRGAAAIRSGFSSAFNPYDDRFPADTAQAVELPEKWLPFKPAMIAHYIGAGHMAAKRIAGQLSGNPAKAARLVEMDGQVSGDDIKLERFQNSAPAACRDRKRQTACTRESILEEADRCLSCGTCNGCGQCVRYCPDASIRRNETGVAVDLFHCKGCGVCAYECPRGVITMEGGNS